MYGGGKTQRLGEATCDAEKNRDSTHASSKSMILIATSSFVSVLNLAVTEGQRIDASAKHSRRSGENGFKPHPEATNAHRPQTHPRCTQPKLPLPTTGPSSQFGPEPAILLLPGPFPVESVLSLRAYVTLLAEKGAKCTPQQQMCLNIRELARLSPDNLSL